MNDNKNNILSSASHYALYLGLFWVFKYLFVIGGEYSELSKYIYNVLNIGTPLLLYVLLCKYRDTALDGKITYGQSILFTLALFSFASLIEAVIISLHLFIISPSLVVNWTSELYSMYEKMPLPAESMQLIRTMLSFGALLYIFYMIIFNFISGLFLSLIFGYFVSRQNNTPSQKL